MFCLVLYRLFVWSFCLFVSVPAKISCLHDYRQELALSLLYYLDIGRNLSPKVIEAKKYERNRQNIWPCCSSILFLVQFGFFIVLFYANI